MKLGKYTDRPNSFAIFETYQKTERFHTNTSNVLNPENNSFVKSMDGHRNHSTTNNLKLPSLSMSARKHNSTSTTQRNTKNQLNSITQKVQSMREQLHTVRLEANQTLNYIKFLKQELIDNGLKKNQEDLQSQIGGLKRLLKITKFNHESRSNQLRQEYIRLWNQTQQFRQLMFQMQMRMDKIEEDMGIRET